MIVNSNDILKKAYLGKYAIPHFNINNLEWTRFILEECDKNNSPVILGVSEGAIKYMGGYNVVNSIVRELVKSLDIKVPVVLHLDHGSSVESAINAILNGFTSVMIDASNYDLETNIKMTKEVVECAKKNNVSTEAEIGHIGGSEDDNYNSLAYAKVEDAIKLVNETNVDSLASALGSVHGIYKGEAKLDFDKMLEISNKTNIPLVLHGGSGIDDIKIKKAISSGICKININTELQIVWSNEVRKFLNNNNDYDPRKIIKSGEEKMKEVVRNKIFLLGSNDKYKEE